MRLADTTPDDVRRYWARLDAKLEGVDHLEQAAELWVSSFYELFEPSLVLVRAFLTLPFALLPERERLFAAHVASSHGETGLGDETPVLCLLSTRGMAPAWNDRRQSAGHVAIPLVSPEFIEDVPMLAALLHELGLPLAWLRDHERSTVERALGSLAALFHVDDARTHVDERGRRVIPAQDFVEEYGVQSVFGVGGAYLGGSLLVFIAFAQDRVSADVTRRFLALVNLFKGKTYRLLRPDNVFLEEVAPLRQPARAVGPDTPPEIGGDRRMAALCAALQSARRGQFHGFLDDDPHPLEPPALSRLCTEARQLFECIERTLVEKEAIVGELELSQAEVALTNDRLTQAMAQRKVLEAQMLHAQKLEAIGELAAGIAHEINTPAQYVGDNVEFLQRSFEQLGELLQKYHLLQAAAEAGDVPPELLSEVRRAAEDADLDFLTEEIPLALSQSREGIARVAEIVRAMKEFSHPGTAEKEPVDLNRAIENSLTVTRNAWKHVADIETSFDVALPLVPCLRGELNQVVVNIVVNAAQALAEVQSPSAAAKGLIRIHTAQEADGRVLLEISDNGPGMPEEVRRRVFDSFFTTKDVGKGTGQGLAIARSVIVDKHQGTIDVASRPGRGTTFRIRLPLLEAPALLDDPATCQPSPGTVSP